MSGLFGSKPSPFGAPASTTPSSSIFDTNPNATTSTSQPQQTSGTSLFGAASAQPATSSGNSLFGATAANSSAPKSGGGLFGASTTTSQPTTSGGLFGGTGTTTAKSPFSALGTSTTQDQQPASTLGLSTNNAGTSILGTSQAPGNNAHVATASQSPAMGYFDELLAKNKRQAGGENPLRDIPTLQLGLGDLRQKLRKLGPSTQDPLQSNRAQYMLAASGVDPGAAVKDLNFFDIQSGRHDRPVPGATSEIDVDTYLANLQQKTTLSMIADGLERSVRDFDNFLEDNITMEWEAQRRRIYEHFGIKTRDENDPSVGVAGKDSLGGFGRSRRNKNARSAAATERGGAFGRSNLQKSVIGTPSKIGSHKAEFVDVEDKSGKSGNGAASMDDRFLREKQGKLAERVRELDNARLEQRPFPVLHEFSEVENRSGDRHAKQVVEAYQAVMAMVGENPEAETFVNNATAKERQFAKMYLDLQNNSQQSMEMRKRILRGANQFLEKEFFQGVETLVTKYPREANLGGRPDAVSKIKAYVRLRHARKDLVPDNTFLQDWNGEYIWAILFYLLRSGHITEAADYVKAYATTFRSVDRTFASYLLEYASSDDRRLRRGLQERCNNEYTQRARNAPDNSIDPFRMACYKIVGRCEVNNRNLDGFNTEINDWIWLQFNLARENDKLSEVAGESYTLSNLQETIREIGLKHFPKTPADDVNGTFGMFFFLQILSGMFEQAIAYLYPFSYVDAIHFAIGLEYYGLLRASDPWTNPSELLSYNTRSQPQISFGRMLGYYTRDFRAADVVSAVDYLALICLNADLGGDAGRQQAELCHTALRELVLETREFSKLIGDIRSDGHRITGLIEERGPLIGLQEEDEFIMAVTLQAAKYADDSGRTTDAVLLYHLAEDYDSVVAIISRALSDAIALEIGEDPMRLMPVKPRADGKEAEAPLGNSLSLAAIDEPVELAKSMMSIYGREAMFYNKVQEQNLVACQLLLQMNEIKDMFERGMWSECLDKIKNLGILPMQTKGDPSQIRNYASRFAGLPPTVHSNVPPLLLWTVRCCTNQRQKLMSGQYSVNQDTKREMIDQLKQISMDLTTYTSQLKYRFPPHLIEELAKASAD